MSPELAPAPVTPPPVAPPPSTSLHDLWSKWKSNVRTKPVMTEIEEKCKKEFDDDSDNDDLVYEFDPKAGFEYCIFMAHGFKKENAELKARISQMENEHERQMFDMQRKLRDMEVKLATLTESYCKLYTAHEELMTRCSVLEEENKQLREANVKLLERCTTLEDENKQLRERCSTLEDENKNLSSRCQTLEVENKQLQERVSVLESK
jgi:hypothetical protein